MGRMRVKATKCKCKEVDRILREHFINGINYQTITAETIGELSFKDHEWSDKQTSFGIDKVNWDTMVLKGHA